MDEEAGLCDSLDLSYTRSYFLCKLGASTNFWAMEVQFPSQINITNNFFWLDIHSGRARDYSHTDFTQRSSSHHFGQSSASKTFCRFPGWNIWIGKFKWLMTSVRQYPPSSFFKNLSPHKYCQCHCGFRRKSTSIHRLVAPLRLWRRSRGHPEPWNSTCRRCTQDEAFCRSGRTRLTLCASNYQVFLVRHSENVCTF
jgi:hypothetical protein